MPKPNQIPVPARDLVWIAWKDAFTNRGHLDPDSLSSVSLVTNYSVGWILHENEERLVIANGVSGTEEYDYQVIPTGWIVARTHVGRPRRPKTPKETE